jgi:hypothetical protein
MQRCALVLSRVLSLCGHGFWPPAWLEFHNPTIEMHSFADVFAEGKGKIWSSRKLVLEWVWREKTASATDTIDGLILRRWESGAGQAPHSLRCIKHLWVAMAKLHKTGRAAFDWPGALSLQVVFRT